MVDSVLKQNRNVLKDRHGHRERAGRSTGSSPMTGMKRTESSHHLLCRRPYDRGDVGDSRTGQWNVGLCLRIDHRPPDARAAERWRKKECAS